MDKSKNGANGALNFSRYVSGEFDDQGNVIGIVYSKGANFIVYGVKGRGGVTCIWGGISPEQNAFVQKIIALGVKSVAKFKTIVPNEVDTLTAAAYQIVFNGDTGKSADLAIAQLEEYIQQAPEVKAVIAFSPHYSVWISGADRINYRYSSDMLGVEESVSEFTRIGALADAVLPQANKAAFNRQLGAALVMAFKLKPGKETREIFGPVELLIESILQNDLRIKYLMVTTLSVVILVSLAYAMYALNFLPPSIRMALVSVSGGFVGALISVLERSSTLQGKVSESLNLIVFQGVLRILLGGIFGLTAYSAAQLNIAFGFLGSTNPALLLLGLAAGFSERLIPELIQSISSTKEKR
jgi:hypothetical protein